MTVQRALGAAKMSGAESKVAAVGTVASLTALLSSMACCVLPLALAGLGLGIGGLGTLAPYRWPLTIVAGIVAGAGWFLYLRTRRACAGDPECGAAPNRATLVMLCIASLVVAMSAPWGFIEQPLMRALGGA